MALTIIATGIIGVAASIGIAAIWRQDALALLIPMLLGYLIPVLLLGTPSIAGLAKPSGLTRKEGAALIKIGLAGVVTAPIYWLAVLLRSLVPSILSRRRSGGGLFHRL